MTPGSLFSRQDAAEEAGSFTVTIECDGGNEFDGRIGLRVSAIFVILVGSFLGCITPLLLARFPERRVPSIALFGVRYFGSGVIVATAFIHLLAPAIESLTSPCLPEGSIITEYPWTEGICLMSVFAMFFAEMLAQHFALSREQGEGNPAADPEHESAGGHDKGDDIHSTHPSLNKAPQGSGAFSLQMTGIFVLEFGVIFHSVLIGLSLAVSGDEFVVLYTVLVFHQTFEGLGLGSRFALVNWPPGKAWVPYLLSFAYSLSTPIAIAIGLGVREAFRPGTETAMIVSGVFDSISAGILLYTGLVGLMARDLLVMGGSQRKSLRKSLCAFVFMCLGAGLMALLGKWA
ncbi:related to ZRT2 - Zinc transporter II [Cephalotrichum gorgonifer]|uniref:Related to ZRT2 - Zinc transporter II n=1 Tax=Cephalotrichum gorgonifer TaxID=2041049 RepID=A0AAE8SZ15_9PEZI|nr:related to ZRT2 - Zinc transporter II [Cephalotrichum gorgonifer]